MRFKRPARTRNGFTLIEILVVIVILALVTLVAIPVVDRVFRDKIKSAVMRIAGMSRYIYSEAVLKHRVYRMVIDLDQNAYFVEYSNKDVVLLSPEEEAELRRKEADGDLTDEEKKKLTPFTADSAKFSGPKKLPPGVVFMDVMKEKAGKAVTGGKVYIHFFPNGHAERAIIHLREESGDDVTYSLVIKSITGQMQLFHDYVEEF